MKLALYSDLHLEHSDWRPPAIDVDVVILAGDIHAGTQGVEWAADTFRVTKRRPLILYTPGNHEYYNREFLKCREQLRRAGERRGVKVLDNHVVESEGVRFLGTTLWSDFRFYDSDLWTTRSLQTAADAISDYGAIRMGERAMQPSDTVALHRSSRTWLSAELKRPYRGRTIVITHFAPHPQCVAPQYDSDTLTPYFVVNLKELMLAHKIDVWAFGHTHHNVDFTIETGCRVLSNQRGYPHESSSTASGFRSDLVVEIV